MIAHWLSSPAVVLIDGRAGSGKTTLAGRLAGALGARILHLDDLTPGWDGLALASAAVATALDRGSYRRYDWVRGDHAETRALEPGPLVIEGCGAVTARNLAAALAHAGGAHRGATVWSIWVSCPDSVRRTRALDRDGDIFAPHWDRWARQEDAHLEAARPLALVDEIVHTAE